MRTQRVAVFDAPGGGGAAFQVGSAPVADPGPQEVRFRVSAFALNQADILLTEGRHFVRAELPIRLGYEGCGVVEAVGAEVTRWRSGERVTAIPNVDGPYWTGGEYALAHEDFLTAWPDGYSAAQATSLWMQALTPYYPFAELFPFALGDWVMITAASGGTGLGSIRMAKLLGAQVIATTRSERKHAVLKAHGADHVLSTETDGFAAAVREVTGGAGVRLINDTLGGRYVATLAETLTDRGVMFIHGALAGDNQLSLPILTLVYRRAGIYGYSLINELRRPGALAKGRDFVLQAVARGELAPPLVDSVFPLEEVGEAYARMREGAQTGKIVVSVSEEG